MPAVLSRIGVDLQPVDVRDDDAIAWLRACIWPEHISRVRLFTHAVEIARADPPRVVQGDFLEALPDLIAGAPHEAAVCVFHTAALAYVPREQRERFADLVAGAGRVREVYWVAAEGPRILAGIFPEAEITGPEGGYALVTGRAGHDAAWVGEAAYHGRWLRWR
jgi:hypothetical protein